jgi:prepilin-type N-terminal cleavage/methylation domain-containing protein
VDRKVKLLLEQGFSLIEVTVAITIFAFFATAFLASQGYNVQDSTLSQEQLTLQLLAEREINKLVIDPPKFNNVTANMKETKKFEESEYKDFEYTIEMKKLTIPDFAQLFAQKGGTTEEGKESYDGDYFNENQQGGAAKNSTVEKMIFEEMKKNIERIIWQARITVTNKETKYSFTLSTFLTNYNEKVTLNVSF